MAKSRLTKRQRKKLRKTLARLAPPPPTREEIVRIIREEFYKKFPMLKGYGIVD